MYVDNQIVIDEITPKDRFGKIFKNNTLYVSNSINKSIMSYVYNMLFVEDMLTVYIKL